MFFQSALRKRFGTAVIIGLLGGVPSVARAEECDDPNVKRIRAAAIAQSEKDWSQFTANPDCRLIPGMLANLRRSNQMIAQAVKAAAPRCTLNEASSQTLSQMEASWHRVCVNKGKAGSRPTARCSMPPQGRTVRRDNSECIQATNTNSEPRCKFSFSYISSITKRSNGPVVNAGETDVSVCTARPGETLRFERWQETTPSAR
jgi:hypothetical protein